MENVLKSIILPLLFVSMTTFGQNERSINNINNSMPNRISMNVTVPKQTQGATFGEKVNAGIHAAGSYVVFPNKQGFLITKNRISEMTPAEASKVNSGIHATGSAIAQGASLVGGALPGGAIISAKLSKLDGSKAFWELNDQEGSFLLPADLADGTYELIVVVKATSGLKDTLKTQVRFGIHVENHTYKVISAGLVQST